MGSSQSCGPLLVRVNIMCCKRIYSQKGSIISRTTHITIIVGISLILDIRMSISTGIRSRSSVTIRITPKP